MPFRPRFHLLLAVLFWAGLFVVPAGAPPAQKIQPPELPRISRHAIYYEVRKALIPIWNQTGSRIVCTGTAIEGRVVIALHCVENTTDMTVKAGPMKEEVRVTYRDGDLALLLMSWPHSLKMREETLGVGEEIYAFGYGFGETPMTFKVGYISRPEVGDELYFDVVGGLNGGMSGGPVTDVRGRAIAINKGLYTHPNGSTLHGSESRQRLMALVRR